MIEATHQPDSHAVVFDVNVYMDVAARLGRSATWQQFLYLGYDLARNHVPHYDHNGSDSVVALYYASQRFFAGDQSLYVWTSDHIVDLLLRKLTQPDDAIESDDRGFGWSHDEAVNFLEQVHDELVWGPDSDPRGGDSILVKHPYGPAGLGRDDGLVLRTARECASPLEIKYCVTKDRKFREIGDPTKQVTVLQPHQWVTLVRDSKRAITRGAVRPVGRHRR